MVELAGAVVVGEVAGKAAQDRERSTRWGVLLRGVTTRLHIHCAVDPGWATAGAGPGRSRAQEIGIDGLVR